MGDAQAPLPREGQRQEVGRTRELAFHHSCLRNQRRRWSITNVGESRHFYFACTAIPQPLHNYRPDIESSPRSCILIILYDALLAASIANPGQRRAKLFSFAMRISGDKKSASAHCGGNCRQACWANASKNSATPTPVAHDDSNSGMPHALASCSASS
jgi:hypothetical protein